MQLKPWFPLVVLCGWLALSTMVAASPETEHAYALGVSSLAKQEFKQAALHFSKVVQGDPRHRKALYYYALTLEKLDDNDAAYRAIESLLALEPNNVEALVLGGMLQSKLNQSQAALLKLTEATSLAPNHAKAFFHRGLVELAVKAYRPSLASFTQASRLDAKYEMAANYYRGLAHLRLQEESEAIIALETVRNRDSKSRYAELADKLLQKIEGKAAPDAKAWLVALLVGMEYDSNVVLEPDTIQITDEDDLRGVALLRLGYDLPWLAASYNFYQSMHTELNDFNIQSHRVLLDAHHETKWEEKPFIFGLRGVSATTLISNSLSYFSAAGSLEPYLRRQWNQHYTFALGSKVEYTDFRAADDLRDQIAYGMSFHHLLKFLQNRYMIGLRTTLRMEDAEREFDLLKVVNELQMALEILTLSLTMGGGYERLFYYRNAADREDNRISAQVGVSKNFAPVTVAVGYQYTLNDSNLAQFEYFRHIASLNVGIEF